MEKGGSQKNGYKYKMAETFQFLPLPTINILPLFGWRSHLDFRVRKIQNFKQASVVDRFLTKMSSLAQGQFSVRELRIISW